MVDAGNKLTECACAQSNGSGFPFVLSGHLVEAILCDDALYSPTRELTMARLKASFSTGVEARLDALVEAAKIADAKPYNWRDTMRSHMDLAEFYFAAGRWSDCATQVQLVLEILERYFSPGNDAMAELRVVSTVCRNISNDAMAELHVVRGFCLAAQGCQLGSQREILIGQRMLTCRK